jgi:hypothetical protein
MDTLYYSNYCKHSQKVLQYLVKGNFINQVNFLCVDKRTRDANNNQIYIILEDGKRVIMPPNIQSVPALFLVKQNYRVLLGEDIIHYFQPKTRENTRAAVYNEEPTGVSISASNQGMNIMSEPYTMYNLTPEELSAKGSGGRRQMYNYVSASQNVFSIPTPEDTYKPDKISNELTVDRIQEKRNNDIPLQANSPFVAKI